MKKLYLLLFFLPFLSNAQPAITIADEPVANLYFGTIIDNGYTDTILAGGPSQTWNYVNLQYTDSGGGRFVDAEGTAYASVFPAANLALYDPVKQEWAYFQD